MSRLYRWCVPNSAWAVTQRERDAARSIEIVGYAEFYLGIVLDRKARIDAICARWGI